MSSFNQLADRVSSFAESATLALGARAKKMASEGKSIINFSVGEPDFNTAEVVVDAALEAARRGETKYTAVGGTPKLKQAILSRVEKDYGFKYAPEEVIASNGGKQSLFHFFQAALNPGDEVIVPAPYWTSFPEMLKLIGAKPILTKSKEGRPDFDQIQAALSSRTRAFILNSPANPSGLVWTKVELQKLIDLLRSKPVWVVTDDTYYQLVYPPHEFCSILHLAPDFRERTCLVGSVSKSYSMTGWRLGWALGPSHLIQAMTKIQGQVTSGPSSVSQAAAVSALSEGHGAAAEFRKAFEKRRALVTALLEAQNLAFYPPEGAFYCFIKLSDQLSGESVTAFCERLLEEQGVCLVPGEAFGEPDYARLSYALSEEDIREGLLRLKNALKG